MIPNNDVLKISSFAPSKEQLEGKKFEDYADYDEYYKAKHDTERYRGRSSSVKSRIGKNGYMVFRKDK